MVSIGSEHSRVHIQRFSAQYVVPAQHPSPERVRTRLDEAVTGSLRDALGAALAPLLPETDPSIWLIRRLEVQVDVNAAWDGQQIARAWTPQITRSLATVLQDGQDGESVLWFPDRAAYLSRFLVDAAEGRSAGKWYYEAFDNLRLLPTSALLRTAICEQPAIGKAALRQLSATELGTVLRVLTSPDARRILDALVADASAGDEPRCFKAVWAVWETPGRGSLENGEEWHSALRLYLEAHGRDPAVQGRSLKRAALALVRLARVVSGDAGSLLAALASGDLPALYSVAGAGDAEVLAPLLRCPRDWVRDVVQVLLSKRAAEQAPTEVCGLRDTPFGGSFLLLPLLDTLPLEQATHGWPDAAEATPAALVRFLLLLKCCGRSRANQMFRDPVIRDLMAVPPALSTADLADWQARVSSAQRRTFLDVMASWHVETGALGGRVWILTCVRAPRGPIALLIDGARGVWLFAAGCRPSRPARRLRELRRMTLRDQAENPIVLSDDGWTEALNAACRDLRTVGLGSDAARALAQEDASLAEVLARMDRLADDWSYLSLPKTLGIGRAFDMTLSVAAQGVMRALAWRLPGFAGSNLPYLHCNFLEMGGSVEEEPGRWVVRLGRPPLHLVLNITGMIRASYRLSWRDERPFVLFPES